MELKETVGNGEKKESAGGLKKGGSRVKKERVSVVYYFHMQGHAIWEKMPGESNWGKKEVHKKIKIKTEKHEGRRGGG